MEPNFKINYKLSKFALTECLAFHGVFIYCLKSSWHLFKIIHSEYVVLQGGCLDSRLYARLCVTLWMYVDGGEKGVINSRMDILCCGDKDSIGRINRPYQPPVKLLITLFSSVAFFHATFLCLKLWCHTNISLTLILSIFSVFFHMII